MNTQNTKQNTKKEKTTEDRTFTVTVKAPKRPPVEYFGWILAYVFDPDSPWNAGESKAEIDRRQAIAALMTPDEHEFFCVYCSARDK